MTKTYSLKAVFPLFPMQRAAPPLSGSFEPFGNGTEPWLIRWVVDSVGFWLQVNDNYVHAQPLSTDEFQGISGFHPADLEFKSLEGVGFVYGLPGGKPILPLPFTAMQLIEFDKQIGGLVRDCFYIDEKEADEQLIQLEQANPDAAELARIIFSGVMSEQGATTPIPAPFLTGSASGGDKAWKGTARTRAHELIKRDREKDLYPSQVNLADEIAKELRRDGVHGDDGKPLTGAYIKRHALKGISSAQGKQLSTAKSRGK